MFPVFLIFLFWGSFPQWGTADTEIKDPSVENPELKIATHASPKNGLITPVSQITMTYRFLLLQNSNKFYGFTKNDPFAKSDVN